MSRLVTYQCTNCKRFTSIQDNPIGFSTFGNCNITKNCTGGLVAIANKSSRINPIKRDVDNTLYARSPRKCLHIHTQPYARTTWTIRHHLECHPAVVVYDQTGAQVSDYIVDNVDINTTTLTFQTPAIGSAHAIVRTSQPDQDPVVTSVGSPSVALDANGLITIATLHPVTQPIAGKLELVHSISNRVLQTVGINLAFDPIDKPKLPWGDWQTVRFSGRRYNVRRLDISSSMSSIVDQSYYFRITLGTQADTVFLLTDSPYAATDINLTSVVPYSLVESVDGINETMLSNRKLLVTPGFVEPVVAGIVRVL